MPHGRRIFNTNIHQQLRKELRSWKTKWAEHLLSRFENTKYFQKIRSSQIQSSAYSIDAEEFKEFLGSLFSLSNPLPPNDEDKTLIRYIPQLSLPELEIALKGIANLRSADEEGIVVEMIKYANIHFKEDLLFFVESRITSFHFL